jgi:hypothetical protein
MGLIRQWNFKFRLAGKTCGPFVQNIAGITAAAPDEHLQ